MGASTFTDAGGGHISPGARFDLAVGTAELLHFRLIRRARGLPRLIRWPRVSQPVTPGWWSKPVEDHKDDIVREVDAAIGKIIKSMDLD